MCVLIVKNSGVNVPTKEILTACTVSNPHGFGIGTPNGVFKTLDAEEFIDTASQLPPEIPAILHCRLATHGSIKKTNCHPFEAQDWIFAHNGIIHNIKPCKDMTDSETAFIQIFVPLLAANKGFKTNVIQVIKDFAQGNKFAFLSKKTGKIITFGNFANYDGCMFSNLRWLHYQEQYKFFYSF
jgi:predicted glutamine amidotransferase